LKLDIYISELRTGMKDKIPILTLYIELVEAEILFGTWFFFVLKAP
jgi:hypothetical protein